MERHEDGGARGLEQSIAELARGRREQAESLELFDANAWLGEPEGFPLAREVQAAELGQVLPRYAIRSALVSHWGGLRAGPQAGNRLLAEALPRAGAGLRAVWTGLPLFPREQGPLPGAGPMPLPVGQLPLLCGGVRLFPRSHNFPLAPWVVGELCAWLAERRVPLFFWHVEIEWPALHELALAFPRLPIVVETQTRKILYQGRVLFALMRDCPNVHAETSNLAGADFLRWAARELGARRLLFGSFLPVNDPWSAIGMILDADLPAEEKRLVAGGNLRRLLAEVRE
jgi:hypothetical protein